MAGHRESLLNLRPYYVSNYTDYSPKTTPEQRAEIVKLPFAQLQAQLKSGHVSPSQVLEAYQHKMLEAHEFTNCVVEPIKEAKTWALELEAGDNKHLPLYGIPVSLKDNYGVQGYESVVGCSKLIGVRYNEDSVFVKVLKQQGAVPFVKTNVAQSMLISETTNPICGFTSNPFNQQRSAGGSSGGEGALVGSSASPLGFGGDIGGSIRIPAAYCGIYGLKPTTARLSTKGSFRMSGGQTLVRATFGPMARDVDGLVEAMRALQVPRMWELDTKTPPTPFDEQLYSDKRPLKIGYYTYDGFFHSVPSSERAVLEAADLLRAQGHEVVEWDFKKHAAPLIQIWLAAIYGDGGKQIAELLDGDEIDPALKSMYRMWTASHTIKRIMCFLTARVDVVKSIIFRLTCGSESVSDWWKLNTTAQDTVQEVVKDWQTQGLDAVLCPTQACPALPRGYNQHCTGVGSYVVVFNVLDFAVGSVPVTKVTSADIERLSDYPTPNRMHAKVKEGQIGSEGMPVGVQVAALPWQDEQCLRVMKELENALKH